MEEWKEYKLEDVCETIYSGGTPSTMNKEYWNGDLPWLSSGETGQKYIYSTEKTITQKGVDNSSTRYAFKDSTVVASAGQGYTRGQASYLKIDTYINQSVIVLKPNPKIIDSKFLFFNIDNRYRELRQLSDGTSTRGSLSGKIMKDLLINLPPLPTQQKIAAILSSLDDKIELNNKINENLEQQAQALFKSWFIDFEPFSGKMPEGWKVGKLGDIVEETLNGDWGKDEPMGTNTEFVYCIRGADIPDVKVGNKGKMPKRYILPKNFESKHLVDGDLVIEISGGSPTQSTGRIAYISQALLNRYERKMVCTNFCKALKPIQGYQMFMYYYWQYLYERNVFFSYENGTTGIKNLDINGILENEEIAIPTIEALSDFNNFCNSVFMEIFSNGAQSEQLTNVRDTLLPKLMNGEVEISVIQISKTT